VEVMMKRRTGLLLLGAVVVGAFAGLLYCQQAEANQLPPRGIYSPVPWADVGCTFDVDGRTFGQPGISCKDADGREIPGGEVKVIWDPGTGFFSFTVEICDFGPGIIEVTVTDARDGGTFTVFVVVNGTCPPCDDHCARQKVVSMRHSDEPPLAGDY
jgi:hypothetical protein